MSAQDLIVVGGGPGGYVAAIRAAQLGRRVALVERMDRLGGTCLRVGCIPTKALLCSSELYAQARHRLGDHGIGVDGLRLDLGALLARKERIVEELTGGIQLLMSKHRITVHHGTGRLLGPGRVRVSDGDAHQDLDAPAVILATGSRPVTLDALGVDGARIVDSTGALAFEEVPRHLVVVGGGAIGLELGSVWQRLGAEVTVVELEPQIVPQADAQVAKVLQRALGKQGLAFRLRSRVTAAQAEGPGLRVTVVDDRDRVEVLEADRLLVAVGRAPCAEGLGLEDAGVERDERGRVRVDARWETSVPGVYAIGDLVAGPMLAHKASEEGVAVAELLAGLEASLRYDTIPNVVYTAPELATVGLDEATARAQGLEARAARFFFQANGRARTLGETDGLVKVVAEVGSDRLLGVQVVGPHASELIAEAVLALGLGARAADLAHAVHAHPTLSEALKEAALALDGRAIHG
jgi:dihydrolipoamide dehydrogenase